MNIPRYWEMEEVYFDLDGEKTCCIVWGYSDGDPEEARRMIKEKTPKAIQKIEEAIRRSWAREGHEELQTEWRRYYNVDVIREQRLEDFLQDGEEIAVITRNGYGAKIINCPEVMFVDIDTDEEDESDYPPVPDHWSDQPGCLAALFGGAKAVPTPSQSLASAPEKASPRSALSRSKTMALNLVKEYAESRPGSGFRIYETTLGLRLIATNQLYDPAADSTMEILKALDCDELYMRLCRVQKCFRARLTPKPWRIGHRAPPAGNRKPNNPCNPRSPTPAKDPEYIHWLESYEARSNSYQACHFIEKIGMEAPDPAIKEVIRVHDELCGASGDLQLR